MAFNRSLTPDNSPAKRFPRNLHCGLLARPAMGGGGGVSLTDFCGGGRVGGYCGGLDGER